MKLRIFTQHAPSSIHRLHLPDTCDFQALLESVSAISVTPVESIFLSLNKKDIIQASPDSRLTAIGIRSGDILYILQKEITQSSNSVSASGKADVSLKNGQVESSKFTSCSTASIGPENLKENSKLQEDMAIDNMSMDPCLPKFQQPSESFTGINTNFPLHALAVVVKETMVEIGFLIKENVSCPNKEGSPPPLQFSLPDHPSASCTLHFQSLGPSLLVYGVTSPTFVLSQGSTQLFRLQVQTAELQQGISAKLALQIRDKICTPLVASLRQLAGLPYPAASLAALPSEVKLRIFQRLPAADLARCACVSQDIRNMAEEEALWEMLVRSEFPESPQRAMQGGLSWKKTYTEIVEMKMREERVRRGRADQLLRLRTQYPPPFTPLWNNGQPRPGGITGGDYDRLPAIGGGGVFGGFGGVGGIGGVGHGVYEDVTDVYSLFKGNHGRNRHSWLEE